MLALVVNDPLAPQVLAWWAIAKPKATARLDEPEPMAASLLTAVQVFALCRIAGATKEQLETTIETRRGVILLALRRPEAGDSVVAMPVIPYFAHQKLVRFRVEIEDLKIDPDNEKTHGPENIATIRHLLRTFGWRDFLHLHGDLVNRGNGTLTAAMGLRRDALSDDPAVRATATLFPEEPGLDYSDLERGVDYDVEVDWKYAPAIDFEDDKARAAAWRISHNRSSELDVGWDWQRLQATVSGLEDDFDWGKLGWQDDLGRLLAPNYDGIGELPPHQDPGAANPDEIPDYDAEKDFYLVKIESVPPKLKDTVVASVNAALKDIDATLVARAY